MADNKKDEISSSPPSTLSPTLTKSSTWMSITRHSHHAQGIHWEMPTLMLLCFMFGTIFIGLHHAFYQYLNGQAVIDGDEQQWVLRGGTAIAFVIKLLFTTSTITAYVQWFWFRRRRQPTTVRETNQTYGIIYDASKFRHVTVWVRNVTLALVAGVAWLLPLSAIITPGTIVVQSMARTVSEPFDVTETDFATKAYAGYLDPMSNDTDPRRKIIHMVRLRRLQAMSFVSGQILPIPLNHRDANITYNSSFYGPGMSCNSPNDTTATFIERAVEEYQNSSNEGDLVFHSFTPKTGFGPKMNGSTFWLKPREEQYVKTYSDFVSPDMSRLYIRLALPTDDNTTVVPMLYECGFYNASYSVNIDLLAGGSQRVNASTSLLSPFAISQHAPALEYKDSPSDTELLYRTYASIIDAMGWLLVGSITEDSDQTQTVATTNFLGSAPQLWKAFNTNTSFAETVESTFRNLTVSFRYALHESNFALPNDGWGEFRLNSTTNATVAFSRNEYVYKPKDLIIAYTISAVATLICVALGIYAMWREGESFSNNFSTVLRFGKTCAAMDYDVNDDRGKAADPLPSKIANLELKFRG